VPERAAVYITFLLFIGAMMALLVWWCRWSGSSARHDDGTAAVMGRLREIAGDLAERFPDLMTEAQIDQWIASATSQWAR
jgi:hypothetical protein